MVKKGFGCFLTNCAHPSNFDTASCKNHYKLTPSRNHSEGKKLECRQYSSENLFQYPDWQLYISFQVMAYDHDQPHPCPKKKKKKIRLDKIIATQLQILRKLHD